MKKRLAFLTACAILLTGCKADNSGITVTDPSTAESEELPAATDKTKPEDTSGASAASTEPAEQTAEPEKESPFADTFTGYKPEELTGSWYTDVPVFRDSSLFLDENDTNDLDNLTAAVAAKPTKSFTEINAESLDYNFTLDENEKISDIRYTYNKVDFKVNAFVQYTSQANISVIIDPAYMIDVPMFSANTVPAYNYVYDINGKSYFADTLMISASDKWGNNEQPANSDYFYAEVKFDSMTVQGSCENGCTATGEIEYINRLSSAELALNMALGEEAFKDKGEASDTYKLLLSEKDKFMTDNIIGVNLVDLDFDEKPEVLVSKLLPSEGNMWYCGVDVDIYSIRDGELKYIDTLYNFGQGINAHGNVIGIKTLPNGEKKWFTMSRFDRENPDAVEISGPGGESEVDYLFTLENDKLVFTKLFYSEKIETGDDTREYNYYNEGKLMEFGVYYDYDPYYSPDDPDWADVKPDWPYYTYKDYTATFGKWEIFGWVRRDYCADITNNFLLFTDGMCSYEYGGYGLEKLSFTERMLEFMLASEVDAFYLGEYDPRLMDFRYNFLGDYAKPVIYLYPTEETDVSVKVNLSGELTCTYPDYRDGWNVTAYPDGTLIDKQTGKEYYCLYWEGESAAEWDMSRGEVVAREDTAAFLEEKLTEIGLSARERNEFIIYWLPRLQENEFNYITFQTESYNAAVPLEITPAPESLLRVFMVYAAVPEYFETTPQQFAGFDRSGFTVVEWGGGEAVIAE